MRHDPSILLDIGRAAQLILDFSAGLDQDTFRTDEKTQSAVIHQFLIMGEATKLLSDEFKSNHPQIPWRAIARMRDKLIHHYHGVDLQEVWQAAQIDIPALLDFLEPFLPKE